MKEIGDEPLSAVTHLTGNEHDLHTEVLREEARPYDIGSFPYVSEKPAFGNRFETVELRVKVGR